MAVAADPQVPLQSVTFRGRGLRRPECVLATAAGTLLVSDWDGGVLRLDAAGRQTRFLATSGQGPEDGPVKPNGIAVEPDGGFLLAHLGNDCGGVYRLDREGRIDPLVTAVAGQALPPTNFVLRDGLGRLWITVSTRQAPRDRAYSREVADGFIVLVDGKGPRIVAEGLGYTNEVALDPAGDWLYVNETFARRLSRLPLRADGSLGPRETLASFGAGVFPDGMALDEEGGIWVVSIVSNRVIRLAPDGSQEVMLDDSDADHLAWVEEAYRGPGMGRPHLDGIVSRRLRNVSSIAFGGADRKTAYLGCLLGDAIASFEAPFAGVKPAHWDFDI